MPKLSCKALSGTILAATLALGSVSQAQDRSAAPSGGMMVFDNHCQGNNVVSCVITATGQIDPQAGARFRAYLRDELPEAARVLLSSPGGSLEGGLDLGRAIRAAGFTTEIGSWQPEPDSWSGEVLRDGECLSACAYAFLGGQTRRVHAERQLGFHQFYLDPANLPAQVPGSAIAATLDEAQAMSGQIITYLLEMGIDARLFVLGSGAGRTDMAYPDAATRLDYALETPSGYGPFFLEPFRNGIVAASRRQAPTEVYDLLTQITALCRSDGPLLLLSVGGSTDGLFNADLRIDGRDPIIIPENRLRARSGSVELPLTSAQAVAVSRATQLEVGVGRAMVSGGSFGAELTLSDMDRAMLSAAFRFCI